MNLLKSPSDVLNPHFTCAEQFYVSFTFLWSPYTQKTITEFFLISNIESSCMSDLRHVTVCWYTAYQAFIINTTCFRNCQCFGLLVSLQTGHWERGKGAREGQKNFKAKAPKTTFGFLPTQGVHQKWPCLKQSRGRKGEVEFCVLKSNSVPHECLLQMKPET